MRLHSIDWSTTQHNTTQQHKYDAKYLHLHIKRDGPLFKQYTNIDGHISQKVFNNKLLWLMALDMPFDEAEPPQQWNRHERDEMH